MFTQHTVNDENSRIGGRFRCALTLALLLTVGIAAAGCGSTAQSDAAGTDVAETAEVVATETGPESPDEESAESESGPEPEDLGEPEDEPTDLAPPPDLTGRDVVSHPALGGIRFAVPDGLLMYTEGEYVALYSPDTSARLVIARAAATVGRDPVSSVDDFTEVSAEQAGADVTATGDSFDVLGETLEIYRLSGAEVVDGPGLFSTQPFGGGSNTSWVPGLEAELGLAKVLGGVLAVGIVADTTDDLESARAAQADLLSTLHLLTDDRVIASPPPFRPTEALGTETPFASPPSVNGAEPVTQPFTDLAPGRYQLANLSQSVVVELGEDIGTAPNFPKYVVLEGRPVVGPGFRDIVFMEEPNQIVAVGVGLTRLSAGIELASVDDLLEGDVPNLVIENVERDIALGAATATRFDLQLDPMGTCASDSPCMYLLRSPSRGFAKFITAGAVHRTWWIESPDHPPLLISASVAQNDAAWLDDVAEPLVAGLTLG